MEERQSIARSLWIIHGIPNAAKGEGREGKRREREDRGERERRRKGKKEGRMRGKGRTGGREEVKGWWRL